jgi:hypothetical protein
MLGVAMIFLGNSVLGNLNKHATSQESIGLPFWRLVIASGIIVFVMGFINLFAVSRARTILSRTCSNYGDRASSSETRKRISLLDKSDLMEPLRPIKPTSKHPRPNLRVERVTIGHSSLAASATRYPHIRLAIRPIWPKRQRCTWPSPALSLKPHRVLAARAQSTARAPRVSGMP